MSAGIHQGRRNRLRAETCVRRTARRNKDTGVSQQGNAQGGARAGGAGRPQPQSRDQVQPLMHDLSRDEVAFARDGFAERAQSQRVLVGSPIGTPNNRLSVGDVLTEEGGKMWAIAVELGSKPGSGAVWAGLLGVW